VARELEAAGWPATRLGVEGALGEIEAAIRHVGDSALERHLEELRARKPDRPGRSIVHGDLHLLNLVVADGRVKAVIDWEMARVTHPEFDVARTKVILDSVPGMSSALLRPLVQAFGRRSGAAFVQAYASRTPLDADRLRWWEAAHCLRLVAMVRERRVTGRSSAGERVVALWVPLEERLRRRLLALMGA
jgi:aminoglycoside phosphotransferase (APT) family kinase protein